MTIDIKVYETAKASNAKNKYCHRAWTDNSIGGSVSC
jgi:hypothetical protein